MGESLAFLPLFCIGLFPFTSNFVSDSVLNPAQSLTSYPVIVWLSSTVMCIYNSRHGKLRQENRLRWKTALKLSKNGDKLLISALFQTKGAKMRESTMPCSPPHQDPKSLPIAEPTKRSPHRSFFLFAFLGVHHPVPK